MPIKLLYHHVKPIHPWRESGVFDGWADLGLLPTFGEVHRRVIPKLKDLRDRDGKPTYPFLTKNRRVRREFENAWLECYQEFLTGDFNIIPDFDPETGRANKDHLCERCPNWEMRCQNLIIIDENLNNMKNRTEKF